MEQPWQAGRQISRPNTEQNEGAPPGEWKKMRYGHGVLGVHVDDLFGGCDLRFRNAVDWLKQELMSGWLKPAADWEAEF